MKNQGCRNEFRNRIEMPKTAEFLAALGLDVVVAADSEHRQVNELAKLLRDAREFNQQLLPKFVWN